MKRFVYSIRACRDTAQIGLSSDRVVAVDHVFKTVGCIAARQSCVEHHIHSYFTPIVINTECSANLYPYTVTKTKQRLQYTVWLEIQIYCSGFTLFENLQCDETEKRIKDYSQNNINILLHVFMNQNMEYSLLQLFLYFYNFTLSLLI